MKRFTHKKRLSVHRAEEKISGETGAKLITWHTTAKQSDSEEPGEVP